jgi:MFS family permease
VILGIGTGAQVVFAIAALGTPALAPQIRSAYGLDLEQVGLVVSAVILGQMFTQLAWGMTVDRFGDRATICIGLGGTAAALAGSAFANGFTVFFLTLVACGMFGSSINVASSRAVATWFSFGERGFALGIRQSALPIGGALAALLLPALTLLVGLRGALLAIAGTMVIALVVAARWLHELPMTHEPKAPTYRDVLFGDRRVWRLALSAAVLCVPQFGFLGFTVLYLHDAAGVSPSIAALALGASQIGGAVTRVLAGRWSDNVGQRVAPLRYTALVIAASSALAAAAVGGPTAITAFVLVVAGIASLSWNGLALAAVVELASPGRSGMALGLQSTVNTVTAGLTPPLFAALVAATSWRWGFAMLVPFGLLSHRLLRPLLSMDQARQPGVVATPVV